MVLARVLVELTFKERYPARSYRNPGYAKLQAVELQTRGFRLRVHSTPLRSGSQGKAVGEIGNLRVGPRVELSPGYHYQAPTGCKHTPYLSMGTGVEDILSGKGGNNRVEGGVGEG